MFKKTLILSIVTLFACALSVNAGSAHNVSGYAWSSGIGWISFNSDNHSGMVDYGVNIDSGNGEISGYAWSETIGWISFNSAELSGCPSGTCEAIMDLATKNVSGWARALAPVGQALEKTGGWDGWISLSGTNYQTSVDYTLSPSEFKGWAWGSDVVGWISFNCSNQDQCGVSDYKVMTDNPNFNDPPTAINLRSQDVSNDVGLNCNTVNPPPVFLKWNFIDPDPGDTQLGYEIEIDDNNDFNPILLGTLGRIDTSGETYSPSWPWLQFGTTYYWRLKVWDNHGLDSGWIYPSPPTFTTPNKWPQPSFAWTPINPLDGELVIFDGSVSDCSNCSYSWDFGDGVGTSSLEDPTYAYSPEDNYTVMFSATSSEGTCKVSDTITVGSVLPPPKWEEIVPF